MRNGVKITDLISAARYHLARPGRHIIAIAGPPGSGKSTLVGELVKSLDGDEARTVAILPMDGFHYDDAILHSRGRRAWKGASDTFDVGGLFSVLTRLREARSVEIAVPVFDRELEISRGSARLIGPEIRLILVEGNYLLLNQPPWAALLPLFDFTAMISVSEPELRKRLRKRWTGFNLTEDEIEFKLEQNDLPNGRIVLANSAPADLVISGG